MHVPYRFITAAEYRSCLGKLGLQFKIKLEEGLAATIDCFKGLIAEDTKLFITDSRQVEKIEADSAPIVALSYTKYEQPSVYPKRGTKIQYSARFGKESYLISNVARSTDKFQNRMINKDLK